MSGRNYFHVLASFLGLVVIPFVVSGLSRIHGNAGMSSMRTLVANARMLSHDYRDIVVVRRSDISRTACARVYYEHGIKIQLQSRKEVEVLITRQSGKGVDFG